MQPPLNADTWKGQGISILWDAESLSKVCTPQQVISLRHLFQLHRAGWPETELPWVNDRAIVVAGLESCIDALPPDEAVAWLERTVYQTLVSFQREICGGGGEAALILWFVDHRRLVYQTSEDSYHWHCGTEYKGQTIPLSRCLFNGAEHDVQEIRVRSASDKRTEQWIGLYHPRIS